MFILTRQSKVLTCFLLCMMVASCGPSPACTVQDFFTNVDRGDRRAVEGCLAKGVDPNVRALDGRTPLLAASKQGTVSVVKLLLSKGADPNLTFKNGTSPLYIAVVSREDTAIPRLLLDARAEVDGPKNGKIPLGHASFRGMTGVVKLLLSRGADPNLADRNGVTALMVTNSVSVAVALIDSGADVNATSVDGQTPLYSAIAETNPPLVELLIAKGARVNLKDKVHGNSPLHILGDVAASGNTIPCLDIASSLKQAGADIHSQNFSNKKPFELCSVEDVRQALSREH